MLIYSGLLRWCPTESANVPMASYSIKRFLCWYFPKAKTRVLSMNPRYGTSSVQASSSKVAKAEHAASWTLLLASKMRFRSSSINGFKYWSWGWLTTQWAYLDKVQQVIERTRAFLSARQPIKYGISSGRWGIIPCMHPSAIAPNAKIPLSFISQDSWNNVSFNIGSKIGRISSLNTFAKTSRAAALHFLKFQSLRLLSSSSNPSSSLSSSSPMSFVSALTVWVRDLWNLGLMSSSRSGIISSSSTSPFRIIMSMSEYFIPFTRTGHKLCKCGPRTSLQIGCSAKESQNSQASRAVSSGSCNSWIC